MGDDKLVLNELINNFFEDKQQADHFKKMAEDFNSAIKVKFDELGITEFTTDNNLTAKLTVQKRENFNEAKLIQKLKDLNGTSAIKTVEVVDMDELENLIYNGQIDASQLTDCKIVKEIPTLKVKENK